MKNKEFEIKKKNVEMKEEENRMQVGFKMRGSKFGLRWIRVELGTDLKRKKVGMNEDVGVKGEEDRRTQI